MRDDEEEGEEDENVFMLSFKLRLGVVEDTVVLAVLFLLLPLRIG
jgi:hypothetical protein